MSQAKVRFLNVRPIQSADLSFNLSGIIDFRHANLAQLGVRLSRFEPSVLYEELPSTDANGRFEFDGNNIRRKLVQDLNAVLFAVRNPSVDSSLLHAICRRQNAFLQRYKHKADIVTEYSSLYPEIVTPDSKIGQLASLRQRAKERHDQLKASYETAGSGRDGVVSESKSKTKGASKADSNSSSTNSSDSSTEADATSESTSSTTSTESSSTSQSGTGTATTKQRPLAYRTVMQTSKTRDGDSAGGEVKYRVDSDDSESRPLKWDGTKWDELKEKDVTFDSQSTSTSNNATVTGNGNSTTTASSNSTGKTKSVATAKGEQTGESSTESSFSQEAGTLLTEFRHPNAENDMRWYRRELQMQDEQLANSVFGLQVPHMETVLDNELTMIDQEVRQLQLNYMHTFLTPSLNGLVTAIYKDMGEFVAAGEPVMRIEDDLEILLVGVVNHRAPLSAGMSVSIKIRNPFEQMGTQPPIELEGHIAAVRGHSADNDEWEIIIRADNTVTGDPAGRRLPLNYTTQREDVQLTIG